MKLSLWQQFSGNHSSSFTVIGEFPTHEDAVRAAAEIQRILERLEEWHSAHEDDPEMYHWWNGAEWTTRPAPIEEQLAQEYNINWRSGVTWFNNATIEIVMDRLVFVQPIGQADADGHPFDQIMTSLGGKGYHDGNEVGDQTAIILFDVTCRAPDTDTAIELQETYDMFTQRVEREGRNLHFVRWRYREANTDLQDLIELLEDNECTNIEYRFTQIDLFNEASELYTPEDIPYIIRALIGEDDDEYDDAWNALYTIRNPQAIKPLVEGLRVSDEWARDEVIQALLRFGSAAKEEIERALLSVTDEGWRKNLEETLKRLAENNP